MLCSATSRFRECSGVSRGRSATTVACFLLTMLPACIGPQVQPAPSAATQDKAVEQRLRVDVPTQNEPVPVDTPGPPIALPLPVPVPSAGPVFSDAPLEAGGCAGGRGATGSITAQRASYKADRAATATKSDTRLWRRRCLFRSCRAR